MSNDDLWQKVLQLLVRGRNRLLPDVRLEGVGSKARRGNEKRFRRDDGEVDMAKER